MNQIKFWKTLVQNKKYKQLTIFFVGAITLIVSLVINFWFYNSVEAKQPFSVLISKSYSHKGRGLSVRRGNNTQTERVKNGSTQLRTRNDRLIVEGDGQSYASLVHLSNQNPKQYGGLILQTLPSEYSANYWFYCICRKGRYLMAWRQGGKERICGDTNGLKVEDTNTKSSFNFDIPKIDKATKNKSLLVAQASDSLTIVPGSQRTIVQTLNSEIGITIDVIEGDIQVRSTRISEEQLIKKGERYTYPQNTISTLDLDDINQKPEVKDFLDPKNWSPPNVPTNVAKEIAEQLKASQVAAIAKECHGKEILTAKACIGDQLDQEEENLAKLINQYRSENGLSPIPVSKSLTLVANRHVRDLDENIGSLTHSWSDCSIDSKGWICLWESPKRLGTDYTGYGYENAYWSSNNATAEDALQSWRTDPPHNNVIVNRDIWTNKQWKALGVGIYRGYAVMWVGEEIDPLK